MKETLEKLWNECFFEECSLMNTQEEKSLLNDVLEKKKRINEFLNDEHSECIDKYVEAIYKIQGFSVKKAFFKGCEFATSFLFETIKLQ